MERAKENQINNIPDEVWQKIAENILYATERGWNNILIRLDYKDLTGEQVCHIEEYLKSLGYFTKIECCSASDILKFWNIYIKW